LAGRADGRTVEPMADHLAYVISQPFPASLRPGFQAVCPTCGVLDHDSRQQDAQSVADGHTAAMFMAVSRDRSRIKDYVKVPDEPIDIDDLRRRQRGIEEALR
jgi:hypothetical protein